MIDIYARTILDEKYIFGLCQHTAYVKYMYACVYGHGKSAGTSTTFCRPLIFFWSSNELTSLQDKCRCRLKSKIFDLGAQPIKCVNVCYYNGSVSDCTDCRA